MSQNISYTGMKNIDKDLLDYVDGNVIIGEYLQKLRDLENNVEIVGDGSKEDFLNIPLNEKYMKNKGLDLSLNGADLSCNFTVKVGEEDNKKSNDK